MTCDGNHPGRSPAPGQPYVPGTCRLCYLRLNGATGVPAPGAAPPPRPSPLPCLHLGEPTGRQVECGPCRGKARLKVHACAVHGECTLAPGGGLACCKGCPAYEPPRSEGAPVPGLETPTVRNLLYHVYPRRGSNWRWNVEELRRRLALFNGRRVVAVVTDYYTDDPREVESMLGGEVDEVVRLQNEPELREVLTFEPLFSRVRSLRPSHVTLYAHAKGVTRGATQPGWARLLYESAFDYYPAVEERLASYPVVGSLKKLGHGWPPHESASRWHYSGSFFWFRNRDLFCRDWRKIDRFWSGIECYLSGHFPAAQAGCLFWEGPVPGVNLYDPAYLRGTVLPAWERWKAANERRRTTWAS